MSKQPEYTEVDGRTLKIWHPESDGDGFTISDNGGWLDGIYDSRESAIMGFKLSISDNGYCKLSDLSKSICANKNRFRLICVEDFKQFT